MMGAAAAPCSPSLLRRWLLGGLVACLAAVCAGCWDRIEVTELAIISGVALDQAGPQSVRMTVSIVAPTRVRTPGSGAGEASPSPDVVISAEGRTVVDAAVALQAKTGRRLFWGHIEVILVGEALARQGLAPVFDFFARHRQPRLRTLVAVVPGDASDVLATMAVIEPSTAAAVTRLAELHPAALITLKDFLADRLEQGREAVVPIIRVASRGAAQPGTLQISPDKEPDPPPSVQRDPLQPELVGLAVFRGDRVVGYLDWSESVALLWVRSQSIVSSVTVPLGSTDQHVSLTIVRSATEMRPRFEGDRIVMEMRLFGEHDLIEDTAGVDTDSPRVVKLIEQELAEAISQSVRRAIAKLQKEFRSDAFGFGAAVRRADPARWRELSARWDTVFPDVVVELEVQTFIRRVGLTSRSMGTPRPQLLTDDELERRVMGR